MKTIIAGSRSILDRDLIYRIIADAPFLSRVTEVFSGAAYGPDTIGAMWAYENRIPVRYFRPEWDKLGKQAGFIRNAEMASQADAAIVIWDGYSNGTAHLLSYMKGLDPKVELHLYIAPRKSKTEQLGVPS